MENQMFDIDGNLFSSMWKSFASGISSIKGSPLDLDKNPMHNIASKNSSPYLEMGNKTPIDKKKLFGSLKQTSSSLIRKAQAMKEPIHSNRKLFDNDEQRPTFGPQKYQSNECDKENNCQNLKLSRMQSPIPSVKGAWTHTISPNPGGNKFLKAISPNIITRKAPFMLQSQNLNVDSNYGTPINGLKGSIVAPSTCGSTQMNFGNFRNSVLGGQMSCKSRNIDMKPLSTSNTAVKIGTESV